MTLHMGHRFEYYNYLDWKCPPLRRALVLGFEEIETDTVPKIDFIYEDGFLYFRFNFRISTDFVPLRQTNNFHLSISGLERTQ